MKRAVFFFLHDISSAGFKAMSIHSLSIRGEREFHVVVPSLKLEKCLSRPYEGGRLH